MVGCFCFPSCFLHFLFRKCFFLPPFFAKESSIIVHASFRFPLELNRSLLVGPLFLEKKKEEEELERGSFKTFA